MVTQTAIGRKVFPHLSAQYPDDAQFSQFVPSDDELLDVLDGAEINHGTEDAPQIVKYRRIRHNPSERLRVGELQEVNLAEAAERALRVELYAGHVEAHGTLTDDGFSIADDAPEIPFLVSDCVAGVDSGFISEN